MHSSTRTVLAALLLGLGLSGHAGASAICDRLSFQLANLSGRSTASAEARKYARAIFEQKRSLRELESTLRQSGCSSGSMMVIGGPNETECSHLAAKQTRMERNLEILESKRISLLSSDHRGDDRQQLVAALADNRCNEEPLLVSTPADDGAANLVSEDPDGFETIRVPSTDPNYSGSQFVDLGGAAMNGTFRTMCVRACDGGYFPVSSHASTLDFRRDAQVCSMMCPGTETELYYHSIHEESADMRSTLTGRSYEEMPNAYRFRTEKPGNKAECGCNFSLYYKEMMKREAFIKNPRSTPEKQSAIVWLKPELRGHVDQQPVSTLSAEAAKALRDYKPDEHIRVIGPKFLPDTGIDFTKPQVSLTN